MPQNICGNNSNKNTSSISSSSISSNSTCCNNKGIRGRQERIQGSNKNGSKRIVSTSGGANTTSIRNSSNSSSYGRSNCEDIGSNDRSTNFSSSGNNSSNLML